MTPPPKTTCARMKQPAIALTLLGALMALALPSALAQENESTEIEGPLEEQLEPYWSVDRDLEVLKNKLYTREGEISFGLFAGYMPSEPFYDYISLGGRLGYFFTEHLGLELGGGVLLERNTSLTDFLEERREDSFVAERDALDKQLWRANAMVMWHPLYGKWALLQRKLSHFDFNLGLGAGVVGVSRPDSRRNLAASDEVLPEAVLGAGFHFFALKDLTIRLDTRVYFHQGPEFETSTQASERGFYDRLEVPVDFLLGVSYSL